MNRLQWNDVKAIFDQAHGLDTASQTSLLDRECAKDPELRQELEALLIAARNSKTSFMERSALDEHQIDLFHALDERLEGQRVGPWRLVREIGTGGMGTVYLAEREDGVYQARAALKIIRRGMDTAIVLRRFRQERQILAQLNHPGIARLIDGGMCADGRPYLAMEYINGCAIDEYCERNALPVKDRLELFLQVCNAVQSAHQHLVVHRDIKPSNILITSDGTVRLLDFGVAKLLDEDSSEPDSDLTRAGEYVLTPQYASPEQVRGELITVATDVYGLGVLLYRLLTGVHPYQAGSIGEMKHAVCEQEPALPSSVTAPPDKKAVRKPIWSRDLDLIALQALRKVPSRRYQSVEQFADDVRRYLRKMPVTAQADSLRYRVSKFVARHRAAIAGAIAGLIVLSVGVAITMWQTGIARQERARAERRATETRRIANSLLFELYDTLKEIPGTTAARVLVARKGTELIRELSQEAGTDLGLRRELAAGYLKLADIKGGVARANTGDSAGAQGDYERAAKLYESLIKQGPVRADYLHGAGVAYSAIAAITSRSSLRIGDEWASKAKQTDLEGMRRWPADPQFQRGLAYDLQLIGSNQAMHGNLQQDLTEHEKALKLLQVLVTRKNPTEEDWVRVSFAHKRLGAILIALSRYDEALQHDQTALDIDRDLLRKKPDDASKQFAITYAYNDIGYIYSWKREFGRALEYYRQGLSIREILAAADPNDARVRQGLGNSWCYIGGVLQHQGTLDRALASYSKCLAIRKSAATARGVYGDAQLDLAEVYSQMGTAHAVKALTKKGAANAKEAWSAARDNFRSALEIYARARVSGTNFALSEKARAEAESGLMQAERQLRAKGDSL